MAKLPKGLIAASKRPEPVVEPQAAKRSRGAGREGKGMIAAWDSEPVCRALRVLAASEGTTVQELVLEGVNAVFRSRGLPEIASAKRESVAA